MDTPVPSQFSHEILNANPYAYLDDAPLEERRARAVEMRRVLPESVLSEIGRLDPAAIAEVRAEAWPDVRDADELHDVLLDLIALPESSTSTSFPSAANGPAAWTEYLSRLVETRRISRAHVSRQDFLGRSRKSGHVRCTFSRCKFDSDPFGIESAPPSREDALHACLTGWMAHLGPVTAAALSEFLGIAPNEIEKTILRLEASGSILRGSFTGESRGEIEWCDRRLLARIHR